MFEGGSKVSIQGAADDIDDDDIIEGSSSSISMDLFHVKVCCLSTSLVSRSRPDRGERFHGNRRALLTIR